VLDEPTLAPVGHKTADRAGGVPAQPATIMSVATEVPTGCITTTELAERLGVSEAWIISRTGIRERRRAEPGARLSDYAARAGRAALARAGVAASELDLVLVATLTADEVTPNTAPIVAHELGARRAGAIDVGAACTAFLSGLALGSSQIESGRAELVLLIGADFVTRITDYDDKRSAPLLRLGLEPERVVDCIETLGNASSATLPVALSIAELEGRLRPGVRVLVSAFGAGFTWGAGVVEWGGEVGDI